MAVSFYGEEVELVTIQTDQPLEIATQPISKSVMPSQVFSVSASSNLQIFPRRKDGTGRIAKHPIEIPPKLDERIARLLPQTVEQVTEKLPRVFTQRELTIELARQYEIDDTYGPGCLAAH